MGGKPFVNNKNLIAYVIGLALGDGNLSIPGGRVTRLRISCDTKYPRLIMNIQFVIQALLPYNNVSLVARKDKNCVDVSCFSDQWPQLLGWEAKLGSKFIQNVTVPLWIMTKESYIVHCLRGLIETDGSIYYDRGYLMVMFVTIIEDLAENVMCMMQSLGFLPHLYKITKLSNPNCQPLYHVRLSRRVQDFLNLVNPQKI